MARRIVCIDTEATALLVRKFVLESGGFEVLTAADITAAVQLIRQGRPDLIMVDESAARPAQDSLRNLRHSWEVPVLLLTTMQWPDSSVRDWVDDYFWRAEPPEKLLDKVRELLAGQGGRQDS